MPPIRLSRLMAQRGLCSRREADRYIQNGWVFVDDQVVDTLGARVETTQTIRLHPEARILQQHKITVALNKPVGYVSGTPEKNHKPAVVLIEPRRCMHPLPRHFNEHSARGLAPAGRLDIDSEGLLILTQDGRIARCLIAPDSTLEKEYLVRFRGVADAATLNRLRHGLRLDGRTLKPAGVERINNDQLRITLTEGRKRQIRRMLALVHLEVLKLQRVRIGKIRLGNLPLGHWRLLRPNERF